MLIALWIILLLLLIWLALSELPAGWDGHNPLPYLIALTPFSWIGFFILTISGLCMHEWGFTACCCVGLIASLMRKTAYWLNDLKSPNTAALVARHLEKRKQRDNQESAQETEQQHKGQFRVMTLNCRFGRAHADEIVNAVRKQNIAVLALQELTEELVEELNTQGLADMLPYYQFGGPQANDNGGFNGIWLRVEPAQSTPTGVPIPAADVPAVTLPISSTRNITFTSAHTKSPMRSCQEWSEGIIGLSALAHPHQNLAVSTNTTNATAAAPPTESETAITTSIENNADSSPVKITAQETITVIMGDLNSSIPHPSFRKLLASGFHDAALDEAQGLHPTFPSWLKWPRIVLDHVLFSDYLRAHDVQSVVIAGTDHLALAATLTLEDQQEPINAAARETWPESLPPIKRSEVAK